MSDAYYKNSRVQFKKKKGNYVFCSMFKWLIQSCLDGKTLDLWQFFKRKKNRLARQVRFYLNIIYNTDFNWFK